MGSLRYNGRRAVPFTNLAKAKKFSNKVRKQGYTVNIHKNQRVYFVIESKKKKRKMKR